MRRNHDLQMTIEGEPITEGTLGTIHGQNPSTEQALPAVAHAGRPEVDRAVARARQAGAGWARTGWRERFDALSALAERARTEANDLAQLDAESAGLPLASATGDVASGCAALEYFGALASDLKGEVFPRGRASRAFSVRKPYGVVGRILAFNHPAQFALSKAAAPLAAGNAVILKPSEHSPYSALRIAQLADEVLPPGLLTVLTGEGATTGALIAGHVGVPRIAATGGVPTGQAILRLAAEDIKHVTLELGGKNPLVAFADVDPEEVAHAIVRGMNFTRSQGQSCGSTSRVLVHRSLHDEVVSAVVSEVEEIVVGGPLEEGIDMGPLAFRGHYERVLDYIEVGKQEGATIAAGGARPAGLDRGFFLEPTVFTGVDPRMRIAREEIFGPVLSILPWDTRSEVIDMVNALPYALTASIWTNDLATAEVMTNEVDAGLLWINTVGQRDLAVPWGGLKASGLGQEYGMAELASFTTEQSVMYS